MPEARLLGPIACYTKYVTRHPNPNAGRTMPAARPLTQEHNGHRMEHVF